MHLLRKIGISCAAVAFSMGLFVATSNAQYRTRSWSSGRTAYSQPQYRLQVRRYRSMTPWQYRRLQRQRYILSRNRAYRNYRMSWRERRRLERRHRYNRYNGYNRTTYRVRNW